MTTNEPDNDDEALRKLLQEWRTDASLPPQFQEAVWRRIEGTRAPTVPSAWAVVSHWVGAILPRPALAASYVALLAAIGLIAGWTQAREETARVHGELGQRYVHVLDPYQTPRQ